MQVCMLCFLVVTSLIVFLFVDRNPADKANITLMIMKCVLTAINDLCVRSDDNRILLATRKKPWFLRKECLFDNMKNVEIYCALLC